MISKGTYNKWFKIINCTLNIFRRLWLSMNVARYLTEVGLVALVNNHFGERDKACYLVDFHRFLSNGDMDFSVNFNNNRILLECVNDWELDSQSYTVSRSLLENDSWEPRGVYVFNSIDSFFFFCFVLKLLHDIPGNSHSEISVFSDISMLITCNFISSFHLYQDS